MSGRLPVLSGPMAGPGPAMWDGDMPPGSLPCPGEAGIGNLGSAGLGEGAGNLELLSAVSEPGVLGVSAPGPYMPPSLAAPGVCGVAGPGYLGGASPWPELGVWGAGVPGPLVSLGAGVLGSPPTLELG